MATNAPMRDVLLAHYPEAEISIIRGFDPSSQQGYTVSAYFNRDQAEAVMGLHVQRTPSHQYYFITRAVIDFERGIVIDTQTRKPIDDIGLLMAYALLRQTLPKRNLSWEVTSTSPLIPTK